jgi:hypothetical protein
MLPVSKDTICYGSADGGKSVHADYPEYNERYVFLIAIIAIMAFVL